MTHLFIRGNPKLSVPEIESIEREKNINKLTPKVQSVSIRFFLQSGLLPIKIILTLQLEMQRILINV